jgi:uncharacterized protein (DUF736 family)
MTDQYDNSNKGAAFAPFESQRLILQGKINDNGHEQRVILVKDQTKTGKNIIQVYEQVGVLFENDKKGNDAAPDYTGTLNELRRLAAWRKMKDGKPYMTFTVSDKKSQEMVSAPQDSTELDDIPF